MNKRQPHSNPELLYVVVQDRVSYMTTLVANHNHAQRLTQKLRKHGRHGLRVSIKKEREIPSSRLWGPSQQTLQLPSGEIVHLDVWMRIKTEYPDGRLELVPMNNDYASVSVEYTSPSSEGHPTLDAARKLWQNY